MANDYLTKGLTGKSTRKQVAHKSTAIQHGIVPTAQFADKASVINDTTRSGKQVGACAFNASGVIHIASGQGETAVWYTLTNGANVVPA